MRHPREEKEGKGQHQISKGLKNDQFDYKSVKISISAKKNYISSKRNKGENLLIFTDLSEEWLLRVTEP